MTITYTVHKNPLREEANEYRAIINFRDSLDLEDVVERMASRGTTVSKPDILATLHLYHEVLIELALDGYKICTPTANYGASIKGAFNGIGDLYSASRHKILPTVSRGRALAHAFRHNARAHKGQSRSYSPNLLTFTDVSSGERNTSLTPGGIGKINGNHLKFDPADPEQGIFFLGGDGMATRVSLAPIVYPKELFFEIPRALPPGEYRLQVRARAGLRMRQGDLIHSLTVSSAPPPVNP
jgi:hypothetical protein